MQSKGAIKLLAILLALVCLYQLSFTFVTRSVENQARETTGDDPRAYQVYLDSISNEGVFNLLVKNYSYQECKERELNLGLDLKGGMNVTLEVSVVDLIRAMSNYSTDTTFNSAIERALQMQTNSQEPFVTLFGRAFEEVDPNARLAAIFNTMDLQGRVSFNSTNAEVIAVIREESNDAIDRTFNILRTRIDKFGVAQPNIQQLGSGRILVELPGVKEPERVRKLLQGTAKLEFWETYENNEAFPHLEEVNDFLREETEKDSLRATLDDTASTDDALAALIPDESDDPELQDDADVEETDPEAAVDGAVAEADTGAGEPSLLEQFESDTAGADTSDAPASFEDFSKENPLFALLNPAIFTNQNQQQEFRPGPVIGYAAIKDTGRINDIFSRPEVLAILPKEMKLLWSVKPPTEGSKALELIAIKVTSREGIAPLDGTAISDARQDFGQFNSKPEIVMNMNAEGAKIWKRLTGENVNRSVAIVLDNYVYSYPTVQGEIAGGRSSITGNFTINEAKDLANILKAGKLPAPARIVEEAVVGPSLGQEAIQSGLLSFIIALILVLIYMVFYYSNAGWAADIALGSNVFFIFGVLASLGAVLTLPGIAGIVLTLGMAVDANILIFERIREELRAGKGHRLAISDGFGNAYSAIIDANVTTLLTGIILYIFGSGPVQGFATTLIIGILTSLFSAIFISRLIFEWRLARNKSIKFATKLTANVLTNTKIDFVGKRKLYYTISGIIIAAGIAGIIIRGFSLGVDFKGGRSYIVRFDQPVNTVDIRSQLAGPLEGAPEVKTFGPSNQVKITTAYLINENTAEADDQAESVLINTLNIERDQLMSSQKVGPTIADDIKVSAIWAISISIIIIFLYILMRFRRVAFSAGAVAALAHDTMVILSIFSIFWGVLPFSLEIDQAFIAAILTVMGYSINDTVVVFDRIREFMGIHHKADLKTVINSALNATLSRTINTSLTIFMVLLSIFIFGGEVIRGFSFALLVGLVVGTYSSVCIATPIVLDLASKQQAKKGKK